MMIVGLLWYLLYPVVGSASDLREPSFFDAGNGIYRLSIPVSQEFDYHLERKDFNVMLYVSSLSDDAVNVLTKKLKGPVILEKFVPKFKSESDLIILKLSEGYSFFDYIVASPRRFVLDFFQEKKNKGVTGNITSLESDMKRHEVSSTEKSSKRSPAHSDILAIGDFSNLFGVNQPIGSIFPAGAESNDVRDLITTEFLSFGVSGSEKNDDPELIYLLNDYVDFPFIRDDGQAEFQRLLATMPVYEVNLDHQLSGASKEENRYAKFLSILFNKKRYFSFINTAQWFLSKFGKSRYSDIILAMLGDAHFFIYLKDHSKYQKHLMFAKSRYQEIIDKYPDFPLIPRLHFFMGYAYLSEKDYLNSLKWFQRVITKYPSMKEHIQKAKFGMIESLMQLGKYDEINRLLTGLKEKSCSGDSDCLYRTHLFEVDLALVAKEYEKAVELFADIESRFKGHLNQRFYFNFGEALFRSKKFDRSLNYFAQFTKLYSGEPHAGYAFTRIGEINNILFKDQKRSLAAYREALFRSGYAEDHPSVFAKVRLLEMQIPHLAPRAQLNAIEEILKATSASKIPFASDFGRFIISKKLADLKDFDRAIQLLIPIYRNDHRHPLRHVYFKKIQQLQAQKLISLVDDRPVRFLKNYDDLKKEWFSESHRFDLNYGLGRAYFKLGDFKSATERFNRCIHIIEQVDLSKPEGRLKAHIEQFKDVSYMTVEALLSAYQASDWKTMKHLLAKGEQHLSRMKPNQKKSYFLLKTHFFLKNGRPDLALRFVNDFNNEEELVSDLRHELLELEADAYQQLGLQDRLLALSSTWSKLCLSSPNSSCYLAFKKIFNVMLPNQTLLANEKLIVDYLTLYSAAYDTDEQRYYFIKSLLNGSRLDQAKDLLEGFKGHDQSWKLLAQETINQVQFNSEISNILERIPRTRQQRGVANE
ncbi:MAG: tetratricopeptide repeat protein [Bdellovibrionaceae bacterium]|nr:tetratricopeptide repeat protein [Pseudobdellovibrionaceae bacterium]MDW8190725.1 tetratricopeptide repeat protein [Pseudobdellovibrionaceae bacterium]